MRIAVLVLAAGTASGQVLIERALTTGHGAAGAATAGKAGNAAGSILGKASGTLGAAGGTKAAAEPGARASGGQRAAIPLNDLQKPSEKPEGELAKVEKGMKKPDVLEIMGAPQGSISMSEDGKLVERLRYKGGRITLTDGAVSTVEPNS